jgi:hypothetical protein
VNSAGASEARVAAAAAANLGVSVLLEVWRERENYTHCIMPVLGSRGIPQDKVRITKNFVLLLVIFFSHVILLSINMVSGSVNISYQSSGSGIRCLFDRTFW